MEWKDLTMDKASCTQHMLEQVADSCYDGAVDANKEVNSIAARQCNSSFDS
jgi:hypothetical protein